MLHVVVILISIGSLFGQIIERGDPDYRRKTNIDINLFSLLHVVKLSYKLRDLTIDESIFMDDY